MRTLLLLTFLGTCLISWAQNPNFDNPQFSEINRLNSELEKTGNQNPEDKTVKTGSVSDSILPGQNATSMMAGINLIDELKNGYRFPGATTNQQVLSIPQGWSGLSGYIVPDNLNIETLFLPVLDQLIILYNMDGVFYPSQQINSLQDWNPHSGYIAKFSQETNLQFDGQLIQNRTISLNAGWNLIPVLSECPVDVETFFQKLPLTVIKDVASWKLYWPGMGINTLNEMLPGKAYYVLLSEAAEISFQICVPPEWQCGDVYIDQRDGQIYGTVQIGEQCWMDRNLNFGARINGSISQTDNGIIEKYCYNNTESNCTLYGGLYQWDEMMKYSVTPGVQGICPDGWVLPADADWTVLTNSLGGISIAGGPLKENGTTHWLSPNTGATNTSGFTGLPGGIRGIDGSFSNTGFYGYFWTSTASDATSSWRRYLSYNQASVIANTVDQLLGLSVRCRKAETLTVTPENQSVGFAAGSVTFDVFSSTSWTVEENVPWLSVTPMAGNKNEIITVTYELNTNTSSRNGAITLTAAGGSPVVSISITQDAFEWACGYPMEDTRDGKSYNTVQIGNQCWLAQNLNTGTVSDDSEDQTDNNTIEKYCLNDNNDNCNTYGGLYQWDEMMQYSNGFGVKGICPEGWHLPGLEEWDVLCTELGGYYNAGGLMKTVGTVEAGTGLWRAPNSGATNSSGFTALPSGYRMNTGGVFDLGYFNMIWSTEYNASLPFSTVLSYDNDEAFVYESEMQFGYSVRCIKNEINHFSTEVYPGRTNLPNTAGSFTFAIHSDTTWTVSEDIPWLSVTPENGVNNGELMISYENNTTPDIREGIIYLLSGGQVIAIYLNQAEFISELSVTPTSLNVTSTSGSANLQVTSNTTWAVEESVSWLTVSPVNGSLNGTVAVTYEANANPDNRIGQIIITAMGGTQVVTVTVTQAGTSFSCGQPFTDSRDGKTYNTVFIGDQCWMAQNLNIGTRINGSTNQSNNSTIEKYCYNNTESNCTTYGGLYQWNEMMQYSTTAGVQGICPQGWHVPTNGEWTALTNYVESQPAWVCEGNTSKIAKALASATGWNSYGNTCAVGNNQATNNATGFAGLPGGIRIYDGSFYGQSTSGYWWSSSQADYSYAESRTMAYNNAYFDWIPSVKVWGFSVRCLKDYPMLEVNPTSQNVSSQAGTAAISVTSNTDWTVSENVDWLTVTPSAGDGNGTLTVNYDENISSESRTGQITITASGGNPAVIVTVTQAGTPQWSCGQNITDERDGQVYPTVLIGTQCWMAKNLNIGTRINGSSNQTNNSTIEKYCYNNSESQCNVYGGLYQWDEMMQYSTTPGLKGICPVGWHVPTDAEWTALTDYVSSQTGYRCNSNASYIAKALASTSGWNSYSGTCAVGNNQATNNATGFTGLPGGYRGTDGSFVGQSDVGLWWSSTQSAASNAWYRYLVYGNSDVSRGGSSKANGFSVRCLKD